MDWFLFFAGIAFCMAAAAGFIMASTAIAQLISCIVGLAGIILFSAGAVVEAVKSLRPVGAGKQ